MLSLNTISALISQRADALRELIPAGLMAIIVTIIVGFVGGVSAIGGYPAWQHHKRPVNCYVHVELRRSGDNLEEIYSRLVTVAAKGSDAHKAAVVGDTVTILSRILPDLLSTRR